VGEPIVAEMKERVREGMLDPSGYVDGTPEGAHSFNFELAIVWPHSFSK